MERVYYALYNCDAWKSYSSMNLVGIFSKTKLRKILKERIKVNQYEFGRRMKEFNDLSIHEIDQSLEYGYIQELQINEILD